MWFPGSYANETDCHKYSNDVQCNLACVYFGIKCINKWWCVYFSDVYIYINWHHTKMYRMKTDNEWCKWMCMSIHCIWYDLHMCWCYVHLFLTNAIPITNFKKKSLCRSTYCANHEVTENLQNTFSSLRTN